MWGVGASPAKGPRVGIFGDEEAAGVGTGRKLRPAMWTANHIYVTKS